MYVYIYTAYSLRLGWWPSLHRFFSPKRITQLLLSLLRDPFPRCLFCYLFADVWGVPTWVRWSSKKRKTKSWFLQGPYLQGLPGIYISNPICPGPYIDVPTPPSPLPRCSPEKVHHVRQDEKLTKEPSQPMYSAWLCLIKVGSDQSISRTGGLVELTGPPLTNVIYPPGN